MSLSLMPVLETPARRSFRDEQKIAVLREAQVTSMYRVSKVYGIQLSTLYKWRQQFGHLVDAKAPQVFINKP